MHREGAPRTLHQLAIVILALLVTSGGGAHLSSLVDPSVAVAASGCQLSQVAFCETFDAPSTNSAGTRSGDLDGVVWGVSHATSNDNVTQGSDYHWQASTLDRCGTSVTVAPPRDVQICNGRVVESVDDDGAATVLAMYPRQPFDFAGRTGRVVFDVSNDTQGSHMAWPEFVLTDQPVPAPHQDASGVADFARNSVGVSLGAACDRGALVNSATASGWTVSAVYTTTNYAFQRQDYSIHGCVNKSTSVSDGLNHVEIRLSPNHLEVWATNPGSTALVQLATSDFQMPLTRGLAWMEDVHYNAGKEPGTQADHTFAWDNFGFDGPVLPRDLGFDVSDAEQNFRDSGDLGWRVRTDSGLTLPIANVEGVGSASAALLEFTWWPRSQATLAVSLNGHSPHSVPWPYGSALTYKSQTLAVSVPLDEVRAGTNHVTVTSSDVVPGVSLANVDLILVGAGGGGAVSPPLPLATSTPTPTATTRPRSATATPTPTATPTSTPTDVEYTTRAVVSPTSVRRGGDVNIDVSVIASANTWALVDLEVYDAQGQIVFQRWWDNRRLHAGVARSIATTWSVPQAAQPGTYTVRVGVFGPGWSGLRTWNNAAATFGVTD